MGCAKGEEWPMAQDVTKGAMGFMGEAKSGDSFTTLAVRKLRVAHGEVDALRAELARTRSKLWTATAGVVAITMAAAAELYVLLQVLRP